MRRCVMIGGAEIADYAVTRQYLQPEDYYLFCDSGLRHMAGLGVMPNLIVGDFDSHENPHMDVETIVLPREKDDTDTMYAAKLALQRGFEEYLLLGVAGARLDHTLGNLSVLLYLDAMGKRAVLADDYSLMEIVGEKGAWVEETYPFFSVINLTGEAEGITIENAKYPLQEAKIDWNYQYGISNENLPGKCAFVKTERGRLLLIKVRKG